MPRNVRNWWATIEADGRRIHTGPAGRDGNISVEMLARDRGEVVKSFEIEGIANPDGTLRLVVFGPDGAKLGEHVTRR